MLITDYPALWSAGARLEERPVPTRHWPRSIAVLVMIGRERPQRQPSGNSNHRQDDTTSEVHHQTTTPRVTQRFINAVMGFTHLLLSEFEECQTKFDNFVCSHCKPYAENLDRGQCAPDEERDMTKHGTNKRFQIT